MTQGMPSPSSGTSTPPSARSLASRISDTSEPASLGDSYHFVPDFDTADQVHTPGMSGFGTRDDDEVSSTIGSSLGDSVLDGILSDTSSAEPDSANDLDEWEETEQDLGRGGDDDRVRNDDTPLPSLLSGSYIDADASTEGTGLEQSVPAFKSTASSQVGLVLPDPASSFHTSSDGTTPSGSLARLGHMSSVADVYNTIQPLQPRLEKQHVTQHWVDASSNLWNNIPTAPLVSSSLFDSFSENGDDEDEGEAPAHTTSEESPPYALLTSNDDLDEAQVLEQAIQSTIRAKLGDSNLGDDRAQPTADASHARLGPSRHLKLFNKLSKRWQVLGPLSVDSTADTQVASCFCTCVCFYLVHRRFALLQYPRWPCQCGRASRCYCAVFFSRSDRSAACTGITAFP